MSAYTELEIIEGCCANDRIFQECLYDQYSGEFLKVCGRYARDFQDAEQLLQDGFLKIFHHIRYFGHNGSFEGWMRRIMINTCLDYLRSKQFKDNKQLLYVPEFPNSIKHQCEASVLQKIALDDLSEIIQSLPPISKAVFNLFVMDGFSHKEIAKELKITEGTSQWHVNNARKCLQQKIQQHNELQEEKIRSYGK